MATLIAIHMISAIRTGVQHVTKL